MSRTYRRKGLNAIDEVYGFGPKGEYYLEWVYKGDDIKHPPGSREYKKAIKLFHSDLYQGWLVRPPAWFRRGLNRKRRREERRELDKVYRLYDYEPIIRPRRRTVLWEWW